MDLLPNLRQQRGQTLRKLTIISNALAQCDREERRLSKEEIQVHLEQLSDIKRKYDEIQLKIVSTAENNSIEDDFSHEENFESRGFEVKTNLLSRLNYLNTVPLSPTHHQHPSAEYNSTMLESNYQLSRVLEQQNRILEQFNETARHIANTSQSDSELQLPHVKIEPFTGKYEDWIQFHDLFSSIVHDNEKLPNIKKFQLLKTLIKDEAAALLKHTIVSDANYIEAWEKLVQRYSRKIPIVATQIQRFLDQPIIKDSHNPLALRRLYDTSDEVVRALNSLKVEGRDAWLVHISLQKLDSETKLLWAHENGDNDYNWKTFLTFLEKRCITLESCQQSGDKRPHTSNSSSSHASVQRISRTFVAQTGKCKLGCCEYHGIYHCPKFLSSNIDERIQYAKQLNLCFNCLRDCHSIKICKSRNCKYCDKRHSSLLCFSQNNTLPRSIPEDEIASAVTTADRSNSTEMVALSTMRRSHVFLSTAIVWVYDNHGSRFPYRALLDSASQTNFVTSSLITALGIPTEETSLSVQGIGQLLKGINKKSDIIISSRSSEHAFKTKIEFCVLDKITSHVPQIEIDVQKLKFPSNLVLADPFFNLPDSIDLLIGAEFFYDILKPDKLELGAGNPVLQNSSLGWLVTGRCNLELDPIKTLNQSCLLISNEELDNRILKFWELDYSIEEKKSLSEEEAKCERHFLQNTHRNPDGRFVVALPFNERVSKLGSSKLQSRKRFAQLEYRLKRDSDFKLEYSNFIKEYISLGHMTFIRNFDEDVSEKAYYLPHHGVWKPSSSTTKLRVVFDGSSKTTTGISLNDTLMVGRPCQDFLVNIIIRFRTHNIVLVADIEKMFRQVWVKEEDRRFQRILWRFQDTDPIGIYELNTVTYGLSCSTHLSTRCIAKLAEDDETYLLARQILGRDVYIDDLVTGCKTEKRARALRAELKELLRQGGFNLRKWVSNSQEVLSEIPKEDREISDVDFNLDGEIKTLGLRWQPLSDIFQFTITDSQAKPTKRIVLSEIAKVFDPLGLLGPTIISAKLLMQELWRRKCPWDDLISEDLVKRWKLYQAMLSQTTKIRISRKVISLTDYSRLELHGFSDASEEAYGASLYIRSSDAHGNISSHLLCSKSRVAPLKRLSLPRLELCGAHLLGQLVKQVKGSINLEFSQVVCWSDSTIVLAWLSGDTSRWKTYVSNRVNEIVATCSPSIWRHIPTDQNPSDLLTRSIDTSNLYGNTLWWHGPSFLLDSKWSFENCSANVQISRIDVESANLELRPPKPSHSYLTVETALPLDLLINKTSSYSRLIRILAYCLRFIERTRKKKQTRTSFQITLTEQQSALFILVKHIQTKYFDSELKLLRSNCKISKQYQSLNLYLDQQEILRVGGRVPGRHPILLPSRDRFTELLFDAEHRRLLHAGPQSLLASIRLKFWPLNGRNYARTTTHSCIECFHAKPPTVSQLMSDLPEDRIRQNRAFKICGVDYGGPFNILHSKGRGAKTSKAYIALFICLPTKAIHIELVSELTTSAFLAALKRFISRRGRCSRIYSDNATNFVGARGELKELFKLLYESQHKDKVNDFLREEGIEWRFIPAGSPHQGGLWEAGIKSTKHHLRRILKTHHFTFEELSTLLTQIEACLNSRPLTAVSSDPNDLEPLTPAHFLIGESLMAIPEPNYIDTKLNRLSRWQVIQQCVQHFWKRWSQEYLSTLYLRSKWQVV